jgi:ferredoxin
MLLKKNNFNLIFQEMIRMPNNWMKVPDQNKCTQILSKLPHKIDTISQAILSEKKQRKIVYWIDYLISSLGEVEKRGTRKFGKRIKVLDTCNGCGLCAKNCCSSNIHIENRSSTSVINKPIIGNYCDMCLGCIYNCPQKALQPTYGAFQVDKNGYDLPLMCRNAGVL